MKKGFTLIELLVVIAIIGILAAVTLSSLSTARNKGKDASIKAQLANMRAEAEIYYDDTDNSYDGLCAVDTSPGALFEDTSAINNDTSAGNACNATQNEWAASVKLLSVESKYFCVDSTGEGNVTSTPLATNTACEITP